ncbi:MAG: hypothetical protein ACRDWH_10740, partial [Acidimicrobiia bacterium]
MKTAPGAADKGVVANLRISSVDRVHPLWTFSALLAVILAFAMGGWSVVDHYLASRPVGEGELFVAEVSAAARRYSTAVLKADPSDVVRAIRNDLGVEAVTAIGPEGLYVASTSPNRLGTPVDGYLANAFDQGGFAAIAQPIPQPIQLDGVDQWLTGEVLYRVITPLPDTGALLVEYDV